MRRADPLSSGRRIFHRQKPAARKIVPTGEVEPGAAALETGSATIADLGHRGIAPRRSEVGSVPNRGSEDPSSS